MKHPAGLDLTEEAIHNFQKADAVVLVAHVAAQDDGLQARLPNVAKHYRDRYSFGMVPSEDRFSSLSCHNNLEGVQYSVNDLSTVDSLSMLLRECTKPLVPEMTRRNEMELLNVSFPVLYPVKCTILTADT